MLAGAASEVVNGGAGVKAGRRWCCELKRGEVEGAWVRAVNVWSSDDGAAADYTGWCWC